MPYNEDFVIISWHDKTETPYIWCGRLGWAAVDWDGNRYPTGIQAYRTIGHAGRALSRLQRKYRMYKLEQNAIIRGWADLWTENDTINRDAWIRCGYVNDTMQEFADGLSDLLSLNIFN